MLSRFGCSFCSSHCRIRRPSATLLLPALALLLILGRGAGADAQSSTDKPVIDVQPAELELGTMQQNQSVDKLVTIRNLGTLPLHIDEIRPDCGCTIAKLENSDLPPGGETQVNINFNSQRFEGEIEKIVHIYSNDPTYPIFELKIKVNVHVPIIVMPRNRQLGFGKVRVGQEGLVRAWFQATEVPELKITPERYDKDLFDIEIVPNYEGNPQRAVMVVRTRSDAPVGNHREFIRLETNAPAMPPIDFEAFVDFVQELYVDKPQVRFGYAMKGVRLEQAVRVRATTSGTRFKITGAEIDLPDFTAKVIEAIPNKETRIEITGMPLLPSDPRAQETEGRMQGTLHIFTDLPSQPELQVKVLYLLRI
jgi:hypothetical protein